jgi:hypothetical protein
MNTPEGPEDRNNTNDLRYFAVPRKMPKPTLWPAGLALALTLVFWGLISSLIMTAVGFVFMGITLAGWIDGVKDE